MAKKNPSGESVMSKKNEHIWTTLLETGVVEGTGPEAGKVESPWYVKVLLAFSGWLAALFLLGFIGVGFEFIFDNIIAAFILGGVMILGAYFVLRVPKNEFFEHLALAASLAGQALVIYGIFYSFDKHEQIFWLFVAFLQVKIVWLLVALLQVPLAIFMRSFVHRVFSTFVAVFSFAMVLNLMGLPYLISAVVMFLAALCWLNEFRYPRHMEKIRAIGYGLVLALVMLEGTAMFGYETIGWLFDNYDLVILTAPWVGQVLVGAVILYVVWHLLQKYNQDISKPSTTLVYFGVLLLIAVSIEVQGLTVGMFIMLLGFAGSNRVLLGLGIVSLLFYISSYYYLLHATLLYKSKTLLIVGLALLVVRWLMLCIFSGKKEVQHV
ncbi:MAG: DUF4401 domain-containing protein [Desulfotalea sp.]